MYFGECPDCNVEFVPEYVIDIEYVPYTTVPTGRQRRVCARFVCPKCGCWTDVPAFMDSDFYGGFILEEAYSDY